MSFDENEVFLNSYLDIIAEEADDMDCGANIDKAVTFKSESINNAMKKLQSFFNSNEKFSLKKLETFLNANKEELNFGDMTNEEEKKVETKEKGETVDKDIKNDTSEGPEEA